MLLSGHGKEKEDSTPNNKGVIDYKNCMILMFVNEAKNYPSSSSSSFIFLQKT
jgi:hypothetical protein